MYYRTDAVFSKTIIPSKSSYLHFPSEISPVLIAFTLSIVTKMFNK